MIDAPPPPPPNRSAYVETVNRRAGALLQVPESILVKLLTDPVMAAKVLMGYDLDHFQKARLRYYWWFPDVIDSSGVSTGKTLIQFIYANLRCMLIPNHAVGIYFPTFQTAKDAFWPYFAKTIKQSPIFAAQLVTHNKKLGEHKDDGCWWMEYKNGSRLNCPSPNYLQDSKTQASQRFNTLIIDEWLQAEAMGNAIGRQLIDRVTAPCFNQRHPIWANHRKFLGHAGYPMQKGYERVKGFKRLIMDGSQRHALISFNYMDMSPGFARKYRPDDTIQDQRAALTTDEFMRQWWGIWTRDGSTYYPESVLMNRTRSYVVPMTARQYEHEINILGFDVARGASVTADYSAAVNLRIVELLPGVDLPKTMEDNGRSYNVSFTFASMWRGLTGPETAGYIHALHRVFGFSKIIIDPGGGGLWVYPHLNEDTVTIDRIPTKVIPLCEKSDPFASVKQPIIHFFRRAEFENILHPQYLRSDDGLINAMHVEYRSGWEAEKFHWPMMLQDRDPAIVNTWTPNMVMAQRVLDRGLRELTNVRQLKNKDGTLFVTQNGFPRFVASGKKDVAYAGFYAHSGMILHFAGSEERDDVEDTEAGFSIL